jgi:tRNA(Ile)-lysidine synthase TilS/MesJ
VSAYRIALNMDIPLIIQGENASLTLGTSKTGQDGGGDAFNVTKLNTLQGCNAADWVSDEVSERDLFFYQFPSMEEFKNKDIRAIWLQYYVKEWSQVYNADFSIARGLRGRWTEDLKDLGRYRRNSALDSDMQIPNQMIKYLKMGFGFATDEACYDIREGRLSREEAKWLVEEYDGKCGEQYIEQFCDYISITKEEFWRVVDGYVNRKLFYKDESGKWIPKFKVGEDFDEN